MLVGLGEASVLVPGDETGVLSNSGVGTSSTLPSFCTTAAAAGWPLPNVPDPDCRTGERFEDRREPSGDPGDSAVSGGENPEGCSWEDAILAMVRQGTVAPWTVNFRGSTKIVSFNDLPYPTSRISSSVIGRP